MGLNSERSWRYAIGMIKVDGLEPTTEMKCLIEKEKNGEMTTANIRKILDKKYKIKD